jgi:hypothetical protein
MSDTTHGSNLSGSHVGQDRPEPTGWLGFALFAAIMLLVIGGFAVIEGFVALFNDDYYVVAPDGLLVMVDFTAWGWVHLGLGALAIAAGIGIMRGSMWARVVGIAVAVLNIFVNIAFLAAQPVWSTIIIALDVLAIYALAVHGRELKRF